MSWTPTDEQVEKAAADLYEWNTPDDPYFVIAGRSEDRDEDDPYTPIARAVLVAVGPMIAAQALRDAAHMLDTSWAGIRQKASPGWLRNQADIIEKEAGR